MTDYRVFGLKVRSDIALPELIEDAEACEPDVSIRLLPVETDLAAPGLHAVDGDLLFVAEDVARFRIRGGSRILVEPASGVPEQNVRLFLLGSALGALLHQRGLLPLHANAVEIDGKAVAFMGESGAGKSTLAAWFHDHGYRVLADDVCVVHFASGSAKVLSGIPRLRLWVDALEHSGRQPERFGRSYVGDESYHDKFDVAVERTSAAGRPLSLAAVYLLQRADGLAVEPIEGIEAAELLFANTYRGAFIDAADSHRQHWASVVRLLRSVPVFRVSRQWALERMDDQNTKLLAHVLRQVGCD